MPGEGGVMQFDAIDGIGEQIPLYEACFRIFLEKVPVAVAVVDRKIRYLAYNRKWAEDYRLPDENLTGRCHYDLFPEVPDSWKKEHERCLAGELIVKDEELFQRMDGSVDWVKRELIPLKNREGKIRGLIIMAQVVTMRKKIETDLTARNHELYCLAESSPAMMGCFHLHEDGSISMPYVSSNIHDLFGVFPDEVAANAAPLLEKNHPDDASRVWESIVEAALTMTPWRQEYRIIHPTRGERWMYGHTNPQVRPDGEVVWYGFIYDITEKKQIEERLMKSEKQFRELAELLPETVFEADLNGKPTFANQKALNLFGYTRDEFENRINAFDLICENDRNRARTNLKKILAGDGFTTGNEYGMIKKDGTVFPALVYVSAILQNSRPAGLRGLVIDITSKKTDPEPAYKGENRNLWFYP